MGRPLGAWRPPAAPQKSTIRRARYRERPTAAEPPGVSRGTSEHARRGVPLAPHPQPDTGVPSRLTSWSELSIFCEGGRCHRKGPTSSRHETLARSASSSPRGETRSDTQGARLRVSLPVLSAGLCRVRPQSPSWVHFGRRTAARRMPPAGRPPRREGDEMSPGSLHGTQERRKRGGWS